MTASVEAVLAATPGTDPISPLALARGGHGLAWRDARVAYRRFPGLWLALGRPRGPAHETVGAVHAFADAARDAGAGFGVVPVEAPPAWLESWRRAGMRVLPVGDVGRVRVDAFHLLGRRRRKLRQTRDGLRRAGWRFQLHEPPHPPDLIEALRAVSSAWLRSKPVHENRVGMGWFDPGYLGACPLAVARDARGEPAAFVSLFGDRAGECSADLMRYDPASRHGVMDFLFVSLIEALRERGGTVLNLGLAPLTGPSVAAAGGWTGWAVRRLARHRYLYDCHGLRAFKQKFGPAWSPAYLVYSSPAALPGIFLGITRPVPHWPGLRAWNPAPRRAGAADKSGAEGCSRGHFDYCGTHELGNGSVSLPGLASSAPV